MFDTSLPWLEVRFRNTRRRIVQDAYRHNWKSHHKKCRTELIPLSKQEIHSQTGTGQMVSFTLWFGCEYVGQRVVEVHYVSSWWAVVNSLNLLEIIQFKETKDMRRHVVVNVVVLRPNRSTSEVWLSEERRLSRTRFFSRHSRFIKVMSSVADTVFIIQPVKSLLLTWNSTITFSFQSQHVEKNRFILSVLDIYCFIKSEHYDLCWVVWWGLQRIKNWLCSRKTFFH